MSNIGPDPDKFQRLIEKHQAPIVMVNLLKFKAKAQGEEGTGAEAYARYGSKVVEMIEAVGGKVLWSGRPDSVLIGAPSDEWDAVALVQYPSPQALFDMGLTPEYQQIHKHREAGLERTVLIACTPTNLLTALK
ncbi:MAG: DUF1330 domain-containing protein [Candidatus Binataceae bacterium]